MYRTPPEEHKKRVDRLLENIDAVLNTMDRKDYNGGWSKERADTIPTFAKAVEILERLRLGAQ